jgi:hypothetical protein
MSAISHDLRLPRPSVRLAATPRARRLAPLTAAALLAVAAVHLIDGPGSLADTFYVGALELALVAVSVPLALFLIAQPEPIVWRATAVVTALALAAYVASRTIGLPGASDDIGNWGETLGVLNLVSEITVITLAGIGARSDRMSPGEVGT